MLNYLNQEKNGRKTQHIYFQEETDVCTPLTTKNFFPKGEVPIMKNMDMLLNCMYFILESRKGRCCSCLDFTATKQRMVPAKSSVSRH